MALHSILWIAGACEGRTKGSIWGLYHWPYESPYIDVLLAYWTYQLISRSPGPHVILSLSGASRALPKVKRNLKTLTGTRIARGTASLRHLTLL